jgi:hypothetical protein
MSIFTSSGLFYGFDGLQNIVLCPFAPTHMADGVRPVQHGSQGKSARPTPLGLENPIFSKSF